jgi:hypothetical protein
MTHCRAKKGKFRECGVDPQSRIPARFTPQGMSDDDKLTCHSVRVSSYLDSCLDYSHCYRPSNRFKARVHYKLVAKPAKSDSASRWISPAKSQ